MILPASVVRQRALVAAVVVGALGLGACGDDTSTAKKSTLSTSVAAPSLDADLPVAPLVRSGTVFESVEELRDSADVVVEVFDPGQQRPQHRGRAG